MFWTYWSLCLFKYLMGHNAHLPLPRTDVTSLCNFFAIAGKPLGMKQKPHEWKARINCVLSVL